MPTTAQQRALANYYLLGREEGTEDYDARGFEMALLAERAIVAGKLSDVCRKAVQDDLASDEHDGTRETWLGENEDAIESDGIDGEQAWRAWRTGYMESAEALLEERVEDAMHEILNESEGDDDDTDVATPLAKSRRVRAQPNPDSDQTTYGDWYETGIKDCGNSWDESELDDELADAAAAYNRRGGSLEAIAKNAVSSYWTESEAAGSRRQWESQNAEDVRESGLDLDRAYRSWSDGWRSQATRYAVASIDRRARALID